MLSIVIPAHNESALIGRTLEALELWYGQRREEGGGEAVRR